MTTTAQLEQRMDKIDVFLTPREWAIRLASKLREFPSCASWLEAWAKLSYDELPMLLPYRMLAAQAEHVHPGGNPEDIRARSRLTASLHLKFRTLQLLIVEVNQGTRLQTERLGMQIALRLSALHVLVLQGAAAQAAANAASWIESVTTIRPEEVDQRQAVLAELSVLSHTTLEAQSADREPGPLRFPSPLAECVIDITVLVREMLAHQFAVRRIQKEHFAGEPVLFLEVESGLKETLQATTQAVTTVNDYLKRRSALYPDEHEAITAIDVPAIESDADGQRAADIAGQWVRQATMEADQTGGLDAEEWARFREELAAST